MGLQPRTVQLQAVFFGKGYYQALKKLLAVIQQSGADVLVHPILGRLPNMLLVSAQLRHEADYVNYVSLDLTFKEATEMAPIFVFDSAIISQIDRLIHQLDDLFHQGNDFWLAVMNGVSAVYHWKAKLLGIWGGVYGTFESIRQLFQLDKKKYALSSSVSPKQYEKQGRVALQRIKTMMDVGLANAEKRKALTFAAKLRNMTDVIERVQAIPDTVVKGEHLNRSKTVKVREEDVRELAIMLGVICFTKLAEFSTLLIEAEQDSLVADELEALNRAVRLQALAVINLLRQAQQQDQQRITQHKNTAIYEHSEALIEQLRESVHQFNQLVMSAINRKPPLRVKTCEIQGTIHQVAHAFYGDYRRADELLRLNPQIRQPNFIPQGELLNAYSQ